MSQDSARKSEAEKDGHHVEEAHPPSAHSYWDTYPLPSDSGTLTLSQGLPCLRASSRTDRLSTVPLHLPRESTGGKVRRITREYEMKIDELRASLTKESIRSEQARTKTNAHCLQARARLIAHQPA